MTNPLKKQQLYNEKNGERPRAQINSMDRRQGYTHTHKKNTLLCVCYFPELNLMLTKACKVNMPEFCQSILNKGTLESELEGQVIPASNLNTSHG